MRRLDQAALGLVEAITMTAALLPGSSVAADTDSGRSDGHPSSAPSTRLPTSGLPPSLTPAA
jgi:hypothetical protein